jgi:predicted nucleic acid-binding protein
VLVPALLDEAGSGALARERLLAHDVHVPELADVEVLSVVRRQVLAGRLTPNEGRRSSTTTGTWVSNASHTCR